MAQIEGISNVEDYRVVAYIFVETAGGWWSKPYDFSPSVPIIFDGSFGINVVTGGIDEFATRHIAILVPDSIDISVCSPCSDLPENMLAYPYDMVCRAPGNRVISFGEYEWTVKHSDTIIGLAPGPGPNYFDDAEDAVWVDSEGASLDGQVQK